MNYHVNEGLLFFGAAFHRGHDLSYRTLLLDRALWHLYRAVMHHLDRRPHH